MLPIDRAIRPNLPHFGSCGESIDQGQRIAGERLQVFECSPGDRRACFILLVELGNLQSQLVCQSLDPPAPALPSSDYRRLDEETLPATRCAELPGNDRAVGGFGGALLCVGAACSARSSAMSAAINSWSGVIQRSLRGAASGGVPSGVASGTCPKRQVFGEAPRR